MTAIHTTPRIAHLIAAGKVVQHRAPYLTTHNDCAPWAPGHSHAIVPAKRRTVCRVIVEHAEIVKVGDLTPRDLHDTGHRTTLALATWWLRPQIARRNSTGQPYTDEEILQLFEERHAHRDAWMLHFSLDRSHEPRLLHEDPAQGYTHITAKAAQGEPEAVADWVIERQVEPARERHRALTGLIEQEQAAAITTLYGRLENVMKRNRKQNLDMRNEQRVIEQRIRRMEEKLARRNA